jgi:CRISPR-associated protein Csd1
MLLQRLVEYANRSNLPPTLYSEVPVRYVIELDRQGRLLNPEPTDTADPSNPRTKRGQPHSVPQVQRAFAVKPLLLADKADYTLGFAAQGAKPDRVADAHQAYMDLLARCAQDTQEPEVEAVLRFLSDEPLKQLRLDNDFDPGALITFRVDGVFPVDLPSVQAFWATENDPEARASAEGEQATIMQCLICGEERPVLSRLQAKIKGVPGGQTSGTSIISANAKAFESYGLEASLIAPTCAVCGERFTKAANQLIAGPESHITVGSAVSIFWTREDVGFNVYNLISDPKPEQVQHLYESVFKGDEHVEFDDMAFYATTLSASGGRTVVRDYIDTTIGNVRRNLARWFRGQEIVDPDEDVPRPFGLYALALGTVREAKDLAPTTPRALLRCAIAGTPLPIGLLYEAVRRNRAEQRVTRPRAALIKLVLTTQNRIKEGTMVELDHNNTQAAYLCGRLLAVLERAQERAIPGIGAGIVDRFYGTASSAPASVFGRLMRGLQQHLGKLERDEPGTYAALQAQLEEILSRLDRFPKTLTLEEQGLFALGYYHQRAEDRARARERSERRRAEQSTQSVPAGSAQAQAGGEDEDEHVLE